MWPFKKKAQTQTPGLACSLLTCDGKNHHWSRWEKVEVPFMLRNFKTGEFLNAHETKQERKCIICGFAELKDLYQD